MRVKTGMQPPGGWHFKLPNGQVLRGATHKELIDTLFEYRLRQGLPLGDAKTEIDNYYCSQYPNFCDMTQNETSQPDVREKMLNRVSRWASAMRREMPGGGYSLVNAPQAETRAKACAACPNNKTFSNGCSGCTASVYSVLNELRQYRTTAKEQALLGCEIYGWDNKVAVQINEETATHAKSLLDNEDLRKRVPQCCWKFKA